MKETARSLQVFFVIVGVAQIALSVRTLSQLGGFGLASAFVVLNLGFGIGYLIAGVRLKRALLDGPSWILTMLVAGGIVALARLGLDILVSPAAGPYRQGSWVGSAIGLLIYWYLYSSVKRLSREAKDESVERFAKPFE